MVIQHITLSSIQLGVVIARELELNLQLTVSVCCQNMSSDGAPAAGVDSVSRTERGKATSDAG